MALAELDAIRKHMGDKYEEAIEDARKICSAPGCGTCAIRKALIDGDAASLDPDQQRLAGIMLAMLRETVAELEATKAMLSMLQMVGSIGGRQTQAQMPVREPRMGFNPGSDGKRGGSNTSH